MGTHTRRKLYMTADEILVEALSLGLAHPVNKNYDAIIIIKILFIINNKAKPTIPIAAFL